MKRPWLIPIVPVYWYAIATKNRLYDAARLPIHRLSRPVISVGSLSAGGAGKTPVVIALAKLCAANAMPVDVLSRGFGRASNAVEEVDPNGDATRFGDEPLEIAQHTRVFVGTERFAAGQLAERTQIATAHLLDDGMQHRRLDRTLDIVLLTAEDARDSLLPAGNLREPLTSLNRAGIVILREEEAAALEPLVRSHTAADIWLTRRTLHRAQACEKPFCFCGIARPKGFFAMIGNNLAGTLAFPDHHAYTVADIVRIADAARAAAADGFYCTAKDRVKLLPAWVAILEQVAPLCAVELVVTFTDPQAVLERLREVLTP